MWVLFPDVHPRPRPRPRPRLGGGLGGAADMSLVCRYTSSSRELTATQLPLLKQKKRQFANMEGPVDLAQGYALCAQFITFATQHQEQQSLNRLRPKLDLGLHVVSAAYLAIWISSPATWHSARFDSSKRAG